MTISISWGTTNADFYYIRRNRMKEIEKKLRIGIDLPALKDSMSEARKIIENLEQNGRPPKGLLESFESIIRILDKVESKTKDGIFRGSDAEYKSIIGDLEKIGEKFSTIKRVIEDIEKMDDDALSRFLTKEDL